MTDTTTDTDATKNAFPATSTAAIILALLIVGFGWINMHLIKDYDAMRRSEFCVTALLYKSLYHSLPDEAAGLSVANNCTADQKQFLYGRN